MKKTLSFIMSLAIAGSALMFNGFSDNYSGRCVGFAAMPGMDFDLDIESTPNYYLDESHESYLKYIVDENNEVRIIALRGPVSELEIPSETDGKKVTSFGWYAFYSCSQLTSVIIPDSVNDIYLGIFEWCENLRSVKLPEGITTIGFMTFGECHSLTSVTIPDSVTTIEMSAFAGCTGLTSITIPEKVESIASGAFMNCYNLTEVIIPENVVNIESGAFYNCSENLTICGYRNSEAEKFALEYGIKFTALDSVVTEEPIVTDSLPESTTVTETSVSEIKTNQAVQTRAASVSSTPKTGEKGISGIIALGMSALLSAGVIFKRRKW